MAQLIWGWQSLRVSGNVFLPCKHYGHHGNLFKLSPGPMFQPTIQTMWFPLMFFCLFVFFSSCSSFHDNSKNFKNKSRSSMKFHEIPWNSWTLDSCHSPHSEERTQGPIRYNVATGKLTFGDYHYKPDAEGSLEFKVLAASSIWYLISDI